MSKAIDYKLIYKHNNFSVGGYSFTIDTLRHTPFYKKNFAILTAYNPNNNKLDIKENIQRNEQLLDHLKLNQYNFEEAIGFLHDHQEESYCIYNIPFEDTIELGKKYDQYSIFYHSKELSGYFEVNNKSLII